MEFVIFLPNRKARYYWIDAGLLICGLILLFVSAIIPGILMLMMAGMGFLIRRKPYIAFNDDRVKVHMVWVKNFSWGEFNNIRMKEGVLSLDFRNNKLFQEVISEKDNPDLSEDQFNSFCRMKLDNAVAGDH